MNFIADIKEALGFPKSKTLVVKPKIVGPYLSEQHNVRTHDVEQLTAEFIKKQKQREAEALEWYEKGLTK